MKKSELDLVEVIRLQLEFIEQSPEDEDKYRIFLRDDCFIEVHCTYSKREALLTHINWDNTNKCLVSHACALELIGLTVPIVGKKRPVLSVPKFVKSLLG